jgi:hypothetical protein
MSYAGGAPTAMHPTKAFRSSAVRYLAGHILTLRLSFL